MISPVTSVGAGAGLAAAAPAVPSSPDASAAPSAAAPAPAPSPGVVTSIGSASDGPGTYGADGRVDAPAASAPPGPDDTSATDAGDDSSGTDDASAAPAADTANAPPAAPPPGFQATWGPGAAGGDGSAPAPALSATA